MARIPPTAAAHRVERERKKKPQPERVNKPRWRLDKEHGDPRPNRNVTKKRPARGACSRPAGDLLLRRHQRYTIPSYHAT
jgi:hypothetical protein